MIIKIGGKSIKEFKDSALKMGGGYFVRLSAIDIDEHFRIIPEYAPLFSWSSHGGQSFLNLFLWEKKCLSFVFYGYFPFVSIIWRTIEYEEEIVEE